MTPAKGQRHLAEASCGSKRPTAEGLVSFQYTAIHCRRGSVTNTGMLAPMKSEYGSGMVVATGTDGTGSVGAVDVGPDITPVLVVQPPQCGCLIFLQRGWLSWCCSMIVTSFVDFRVANNRFIARFNRAFAKSTRRSRSGCVAVRSRTCAMTESGQQNHRFPHAIELVSPAVQKYV